MVGILSLLGGTTFCAHSSTLDIYIHLLWGWAAGSQVQLGQCQTAWDGDDFIFWGQLRSPWAQVWL